MYQEGSKVFIEEDDSCKTCLWKLRCPLVFGVLSGMFSMNYESVKVEDCKMYKEISIV